MKQMLFGSKRMPLICLVVIILAACSGTPVTNSSTNTPSPLPSQQSGDRHKLFVFLSGFTSTLSTSDAAGNGGYGSDPDFFGSGRIQSFLQDKFPGSYFLTYSYSGFNPEGKPDTYSCPLTTDSVIADLAVGLRSQISQFLRSHPYTDVYVIGHSLGGVIAFSFLALMIEGKNNLLNSLPNGGALKGVFTLDSPIGGVASSWLYTVGAQYVFYKNCNAHLLEVLLSGKVPIEKGLNDLFNSATSPESQGATASVDAKITLLNQNTNQAVALDAMRFGLTVSTFGNSSDVLWQPSLCNNHFTDFLSTQWVQEVQSGRNKQGGAVYARSFSAGTLDCNALSNIYDQANHYAVLTDPNVQTAIWQVIIGQAPNALMSVPVISTPTITPVPAATPTPPPTVSSRFYGTLDEYQNSTTYQVSLERTKTEADGSFEGKWHATVNGSEEDVIVNGVIVPFNEINRFNQISPDKALQLHKQYPGSGTLLWFTSTSYDVGQDIWLGCEYYGLLQPDGSVQGLWYPPNSNAEGGTFQLA